MLDEKRFHVKGNSLQIFNPMGIVYQGIVQDHVVKEIVMGMVITSVPDLFVTIVLMQQSGYGFYLIGFPDIIGDYSEIRNGFLPFSPIVNLFNDEVLDAEMVLEI